MHSQIIFRVFHGRLARWRKWKSCDIGEAKQGFDSSFSNPFCRFTYITTHFPTLLLLYVHHSSFSNPSVTSPMSLLILQPFGHFTYITGHSPTLPSLYLCHSSFFNLCHFTYIITHSPTLLLLYLHHSSFSNSSFASLTSQPLHLRHLACRPWWYG